MRVLATFNIKGGVGKTSAAVNLAYEAARGGARCLLWDLDPQGAATYLLRTTPRMKGGAERLVGRKGDLSRHVRGTEFAGLELVPADMSLRYLDLHLSRAKRPAQRISALLSSVRDRYDVAVLDCPPGISLSSDSVITAAEALLVPVIPAPLSARTLDQLSDFLAHHPGAPQPLLFLSMVDRRNRLHTEAAEYLRKEWPQLLSTAVPFENLIERMGLERGPVAAFAPATSAATAYARLWREIAGEYWT